MSFSCAPSSPRALFSSSPHINNKTNNNNTNHNHNNNNNNNSKRKKRITFIRHGQTEMNQYLHNYYNNNNNNNNNDDSHTGFIDPLWRDTKLTELGMNQAMNIRKQRENGEHSILDNIELVCKEQ